MQMIQERVSEIKRLIEDAIITNGVSGKNNLIRSQVPICLLHDAAKASFISQGVNPEYIHPRYGEHIGEQKLAGFFKCKYQDICLFPNNKIRTPEILDFDGILRGKEDEFGFDMTQHILSVNVRSQLSSTAKNFDTLYERTFAESLNLHLRCPKMVLGELYMIPVYEYDDAKAQNHEVGFKPNRNVAERLEKYIYSFTAVNGRFLAEGEEYKYERVCLLIVDFSREVPKIYNTDEELIADNLLPAGTSATISELGFDSFAGTLLDIYNQRFGEGRFI